MSKQVWLSLGWLFLFLNLWGCQGKTAPAQPGSILSARDENGIPISLRIESIEHEAADPDGDVFLYNVSYRLSSSDPWQPYCLPDREGKTHAIPLSGYWTGNQVHVEGDTITFACTNGALGKCARFGYKPWKKLEGGSMRDLHQACLRMVRADYCGNGKSHTRDGTLINLWDNRGIQKRDSGPDLLFEAGWSPEGATYVARARYNEALDVLRAECPERLTGRTALELPGLDAAEVKRRFPETLLFNDSRQQSEAP